MQTPMPGIFGQAAPSDPRQPLLSSPVEDTKRTVETPVTADGIRHRHTSVEKRTSPPLDQNALRSTIGIHDLQGVQEAINEVKKLNETFPAPLSAKEEFDEAQVGILLREMYKTLKKENQSFSDWFKSFMLIHPDFAAQKIETATISEQQAVALIKDVHTKTTPWVGWETYVSGVLAACAAVCSAWPTFTFVSTVVDSKWVQDNVNEDVRNIYSVIASFAAFTQTLFISFNSGFTRFNHLLRYLETVTSGEFKDDLKRNSVPLAITFASACVSFLQSWNVFKNLAPEWRWALSIGRALSAINTNGIFLTTQSKKLGGYRKTAELTALLSAKGKLENLANKNPDEFIKSLSDSNLFSILHNQKPTNDGKTAKAELDKIFHAFFKVLEGHKSDDHKTENKVTAQEDTKNPLPPRLTIPTSTGDAPQAKISPTVQPDQTAQQNPSVADAKATQQKPSLADAQAITEKLLKNTVCSAETARSITSYVFGLISSATFLASGLSIVDILDAPSSYLPILTGVAATLGVTSVIVNTFIYAASLNKFLKELANAKIESTADFAKIILEGICLLGKATADVGMSVLSPVINNTYVMLINAGFTFISSLAVGHLSIDNFFSQLKNGYLSVWKDTLTKAVAASKQPGDLEKYYKTLEPLQKEQLARLLSDYLKWAFDSLADNLNLLTPQIANALFSTEIKQKFHAMLIKQMNASQRKTDNTMFAPISDPKTGKAPLQSVAVDAPSVPLAEPATPIVNPSEVLDKGPYLPAAFEPVATPHPTNTDAQNKKPSLWSLPNLTIVGSGAGSTGLATPLLAPVTESSDPGRSSPTRRPGQSPSAAGTST